MSAERILVVDDEENIVQLCMHILEEQGYQVEGTTSGMEALVLLETRPYDLLVVDVRMPSIDGLTVLRHGKQIHPDLTAVIITGYASLDKAIEALRAGARGFVLKPFDFDQFISAIEDALLQRQREQEHVLLRSQLPVLEVAQAMVAGGDVGSLAHHLLQVVVQQIGVQKGVLLLLGAEEAVLEVAAAVGLPDVRAGERLPLDRDGIAAQTIRGDEIVTLDEQSLPDQGELGKLLLGDAQMAACALVPLHTQGQDVGLLVLCRSGRMRSKTAFSNTELQLLSVIGGQIALALENARLYALEQERSEALAVALRQQQELTRLKSEFIQNVSHELRTPLALIHGYADVLASGEVGAMTAEQQDIVQIIVRQTNNLRALVDDIVTMLTNENLEPQHKPVDLESVVRGCVDSFQIVAARKGVTLQGEFQRVPPVLGDEHHLQVVVDHLIDNAIKFTPRGGHVTARLKSNGDYVEVQVADTGIGIAAEYQERIFDRFYQVDGSVRREYGGCGLGLALVREIVEKHGGTVGVESRIGEGSTFTIKLPVGQEEHHTAD